MGSDYWTTIGEIAEVFDGPHATPKKIEEGPYFLSISSLERGKLDLSKSARLSEEQFVKWTKRVTPKEGDVLFSYETRLGEAALMPAGIRACLGRRMGLLRPDVAKVDPRYLLFAYLGPSFQMEIRSRTNSGATVDRIAIKELPDFPIEIPPLPEQKAIAHVLGSLDDRIELNRRMNETLEAMAQALFKSWFVDFDPVIDNALANGKEIPEELSEKAQARAALGDQRRPLPEEIRTLFPDEFTFSEELEWIPKGWEENQIGDLLELAYGKSLPAKKREPGLYPVYGSGGIGGYHKEAIVIGPGIIVGRKGTIGSVYWENGDFFPIDTVFFVKPKTELPMYWFYQNLNNMDIASLGADSAVPGVNRNAVYFKKWIVPNTAILEKYWNIISDLVKKRQALGCHNEILEKLRDTLLPKLLSGELRIPDAEKMIERADG
jgi:type I restriction enzyme S subunit